MKIGGSYGIYAQWFKKQMAAWPKRIFPMDTNHVVFPVSGGGKNKRIKTVQVGGGSNFCKRGAKVLVNTLEDPRFAQILNTELAPLLFADSKGVTNKELIDAITGIAGNYGE
jgi:hypothetical protein